MKPVWKLDQKSFAKTASNAQNLFEKVATVAKERAMKKAARP